MIESSVFLTSKKDSLAKLKQSRSVWLLLLLGILSIAFVLGVWMISQGPDIRVLSWFIYLCGAAAIVYQPRWGIYLILFFALVGDPLLDPGYPFIKNFSSQELIFFLSDLLIFSPMEIYLVLTFGSWLIRSNFRKDLKFYKGSLTIPAAIFIIFITIGLVYGIAKNSNLTIALWEVRPIYHMFAMIILSSSLFTRKEHFRNLFVWTTLAIAIEGLIGTLFVFQNLDGQLSAVEAITDHPASIHMNTVFVLFLAAWLYRTMPLKRLGILTILPVVVVTYIADQRRAAFVSLSVAIFLLAILLYFENRRLFFVLLPIVSVSAILYMGVFWNSNSSLAFPVRALKSVVAPNSVSERDQSSTYYRAVENINSSFTIHQRPLTGVGFGNPFYVVIPLPDISFFFWWKYFPHNSILYIWVKAGVGAFLALLYFIGSTIITGTQVVMRTQDRETKAVLVTTVLYIIMHFLFAYVDLSWGTESMLFIGASVGILNCAEHVLSTPIEPKPSRYSWEREAETEYLLTPLPDAAESRS